MKKIIKITIKSLIIIAILFFALGIWSLVTMPNPRILESPTLEQIDNPDYKEHRSY